MPAEPPKPTADLPPRLRHMLEVLTGGSEGGTLDVSGIDPASMPPAGQYAAVIGTVPFTGSVAAHTARLAGSRRADLAMFAWALTAATEGGRLALIVPAGFADAATHAHRALRRRLIEEHALQAVIALRAGMLRPRTRALVIVVAKGGETRRVWFGALRAQGETDALMAHWPPVEESRASPHAQPAGFFVSRAHIAPPAYMLDAEGYRHAQPGMSDEPQPHVLLHEIATIEAEILQGIRDLVGLLK